jgi:HEAT repeat protein/sugar phosphate permease
VYEGKKNIIEPTSAQKIHALPWALTAQTSRSIYVNLTMAGPVFLLFLNHLGFGKSQIGIVLSIIPFLGVLSLFLSSIESRFGYKRSYLAMSGLGVLVMSSFIAIPWVLSHYGTGAALAFIITVITAFAFFRSAAICGLTPWMQEFIPDSVRGKFAAISNITGVLASSATVAFAGAYLGAKASLSQFVTLFIVAFVIGLIGVLFYSFVPGGRAVLKTEKQVDKTTVLEMLKDRDFTRFLIGAAFVTLGWIPVAPGGFLALYLNDVIRVDPAQITLCASIIMGVGIFTSFFWGWAADRYGSKPIMLICLGIMWFFPLALCLLPPSSEDAFYIIVAVGIVIGLTMPGWGISSSRYLFVNLIPSEHRGQYTAMQLTFEGLFCGITPLLTGVMLSYSEGISAVFGWIEIGQYTPILVASFVMLATAMVILNGLPSDSNVSIAQFAGMFVAGRPLTAMYGMYSFSRGGNEQKRMLAINRLGRARSPLATNELLESLKDPSLNVRIQTMISIASGRPNRKLVDALIDILRQQELGTSLAAAWALSVIGDPRAIPPIRETLKSKYPLLRARAAIALARLGDLDSIPMLLEQFNKDEQVRTGYGDALGFLKVPEAIVPIINYMAEVEHEVTRQSLAYSVASIIGDENMFLLVLRHIRKNLAETREEVHYRLRKRLPKITEDPKKVRELIDQILISSRVEDYNSQARFIGEIVNLIPENRLTPQAWTVVRHALPLYEKGVRGFRECIVLVLHALLVGSSSSGQIKGNILT